MSGQFRARAAVTPRNVANLPGLRGTSSVVRARIWAGNHLQFPLCESFRVATLALIGFCSAAIIAAVRAEEQARPISLGGL